MPILPICYFFKNLKTPKRYFNDKLIGFEKWELERWILIKKILEYPEN